MTDPWRVGTFGRGGTAIYEGKRRVCLIKSKEDAATIVIAVNGKLPSTPFSKEMGDHARQALTELREAGGHLRACGLYEQAAAVERLANDLDPFEIKPAPIVYRTVSA